MIKFSDEEKFQAAIKRFKSRYRIDSNTGCWNWIGSLTWCGYGQILVVNKVMRAHRFSWIIHNEQIPAGLYVLHKCDNRKCVNPNHLFLGTPQDNMDDMKAKGREWNPGNKTAKRSQYERFDNNKRIFENINR